MAAAGSVMDWGREDVRAWLARIGLARYCSTLYCPLVWRGVQVQWPAVRQSPHGRSCPPDAAGGGPQEVSATGGKGQERWQEQEQGQEQETEPPVCSSRCWVTLNAWSITWPPLD